MPFLFTFQILWRKAAWWMDWYNRFIVVANENIKILHFEIWILVWRSLLCSPLHGKEFFGTIYSSKLPKDRLDNNRITTWLILQDPEPDIVACEWTSTINFWREISQLSWIARHSYPDLYARLWRSGIAFFFQILNPTMLLRQKSKLDQW